MKQCEFCGRRSGRIKGFADGFYHHQCYDRAINRRDRYGKPSTAGNPYMSGVLAGRLWRGGNWNPFRPGTPAHFEFADGFNVGRGIGR